MIEYKRSSALFAAANQVIPGGVNSPVRAFKSVGGTPVFVKHAKGAHLYTEDGHTLIDYISSWGPLLFGHAFEPVIDAVKRAADKGTSFGMPTEIDPTYRRCRHISESLGSTLFCIFCTEH